MAKLTFPSNPGVGETYLGDNGITYVFDGVKWVGSASGGGGGTVGTGNTAFSGDVIYNKENNALKLQSALGVAAEAGVLIPADDNSGLTPVQIYNRGGAGILITTDAGSWIFNNTGNLVLPAGGDILNTNGDSVLPVGSGSGAVVEQFKVNYSGTGTLESISNVSAGINNVTITNASSGDVTITFNSAAYNYPPGAIMLYGYDYANNKYVMSHMETTMALREVAGGGVSGSPTVFDGGSVSVVRLRLREAETGASRSFGTTTHAWVRFVMYN
jgi:hypothetical protein